MKQQQKWEYRWIPGRRNEINEIATVIGKEGWEAYAATEEHTIGGQSTGNYTMFLKRPIIEPEEG